MQRQAQILGLGISPAQAEFYGGIAKNYGVHDKDSAALNAAPSRPKGVAKNRAKAKAAKAARKAQRGKK